MLVTFLDVFIAGIMMGGIYALVAIGLNIQWGVARVLNVSHSEFIMLGAFGSLFMYLIFGISPLISLAIFSPAMFGIGILIHRFLFRRLIKISESKLQYEVGSLLAAYGLMFVISNSATLAWGARQQAYSYLANTIDLFGALFAANRLVALGFSLGLSAVIYVLISRTRFGKALRATSIDIDTARLMGVDVYRVLAFSFGIGAMLACIAGALISMMFTVSTFMGLPYLVVALIVVVLGGMGNILGSLAGGLILGVVGSVVQSIEPGLQMVAFYVIFMVMLLVRPTGIFGKK
ncbi:branched-chain amino acid ABC transporter permease [Chloroflexota bacterium]